MNLTDALHVWRRRWILTVLLVLLAVAGTAGAAAKLPRHYEAQSNVALLPSASSTVPNGHNPYLTNNGSLPLTAQILSYQLMAPDNIQNLAARGYTQSFTVVLAPNAADAPILNVAVTGSNKNAVVHTLYGVTDEIAAQLSALQAGVAPVNRITDLTLSVDTQPSLSLNKTARPLVIVLFIGLALALAIPLIIDGTARRRIPHQALPPASQSTLSHIRAYPTGDVTMALKADSGARQRIPDQSDISERPRRVSD